MGIATLLLSVFTFVELNCENLFDCQHDSQKQDVEWTVGGERHWTKKRYWKKINNIAKTIVATGTNGNEWQVPDMIAMTEVENDSVMRDLCRRSLLKKARYEYIITNSPDVRGIDVALLYNPLSFQLLNSYPLRVEPLDGMRPTRDILYVRGLCADDTLHVFVVHSPSKFGGSSKTDPYRMQVARRLCGATDSIMNINSKARIIVAGDFNDTYKDASLKFISRHRLNNISYNATGSNGARGTYKYKGTWENIDNIFVSDSLREHFVASQVFDAPFLLIDDNDDNGEKKPRRNFSGLSWANGFSDHLPLIATFNF